MNAEESEGMTYTMRLEEYNNSSTSSSICQFDILFCWVTMKWAIHYTICMYVF